MEWFKWFIYRQLLAVVGEPGHAVNITNKNTDNTIDNYQWVFCSTIGELNGCKPLIERLAQQGPLVLITDRDCYQDAYLLHFPDAIIVQLTGQNQEVETLLERLPPTQLVVCEIPCTPNDAPCRLSYGFLRAVKNANVPISAVNGWLYEYPPTCRQDKVERLLFDKDYVRVFDNIMVQTEAVRQKLLLYGAKEQKVHVTGNMKFDAVKDTDVQFKDEISKDYVTFLKHANCKVIVAGCVSEVWEYQLLVDAFKSVLQQSADVKLVLAPRHPEKASQLEAIAGILDGAELPFSFKSALSSPPPEHDKVLVLDTFGELRSYYSAADIAYMGRNHNILEPLAFGSPVFILPGWESTYPSYPVYQLAIEHELVIELEREDELGDKMSTLLHSDLVSKQQEIQDKLETLAQALNKNCLLLGLNT